MPGLPPQNAAALSAGYLCVIIQEILSSFKTNVLANLFYKVIFCQVTPTDHIIFDKRHFSHRLNTLRRTKNQTRPRPKTIYFNINKEDTSINYLVFPQKDKTSRAINVAIHFQQLTTSFISDSNTFRHL